VQKIVGELDFGSALQVSQVSGSGRKGVAVQGYLDTEEQRRELLAALQPLQGSVDVRVWSTALMDQSIRQVLAGMRLQLDVSEIKEGKVVLAGVLPESVSEDQLRQALQRDVPGIASLDLKVVSESAASRWLRDQIVGIGVPEGTLSITPSDHSFVVDGRLDTSLEGKWRDVVTAFGQRYGSQLALRDNVTFGSEAPRFNFNIRAINLGPPAYITLDSDAKYLLGSRLDNGMILEKIMPDGMVLRDGETRHLVEIARDSGQITNVRQLESK
jgi:type III secretion system YscD/HrpQ family protein